MAQKVLQIKSMWKRREGLPFHVGGKIRAKPPPTCSDTGEKIVQTLRCTKLGSGQPFRGSQGSLEQTSFPEHKPKHYPTSGTSAEAGSSPSPGDAGLESSAEICFPFCMQPGLSPASGTVIAACRASCESVGFHFWKKFFCLISSTLAKEKAIFLSALRNISHSVEIQLNYYERTRQKLTINTALSLFISLIIISATNFCSLLIKVVYFCLSKSLFLISGLKL